MIAALREKLAGRRVVASVSGGKDSAALSLWLKEQEIEHDRVFMDTGWEHPDTYEYLRGELARVIGPVRELKPARSMVQLIQRKRTFPSRVRRFCTEELKMFPLAAYIDTLGYEAVNAVGIRAAESAARAAMTDWEWSEALDAETWRPLLAWTEADVIAIHRRHGLRPNPLYLRGATRVGCWPCIFARKEEIRVVAETDPERIREISRLEAELSEAAFQSALRTRRALPLNRKIGERLPTRASTRRAFFNGKTGRGEVAPLADVLAWSETDHGGRQFQLFREEEPPGCMRWGLCDTGSAA